MTGLDPWGVIIFTLGYIIILVAAIAYLLEKL
jgi:hypothetical protein